MSLKVLKRAQDVLANVEFKHDPRIRLSAAAAQELVSRTEDVSQPSAGVCGKKNEPPLFGPWVWARANP